MKVESIELSNYRNYASLSTSFNEKTNIFYGNNAQGKTNLLEAIYICSTSKSHKSAKDSEIISFDAEEAHIKLGIRKNEVPFRIDIHLKKGKAKGIAINGVKARKASELFGVLNTVIFSPEDLDIIKRGPAERRRFLDMELCQVDRIYVDNLVNYTKCVQNRNKLLKDIDQGKIGMDVLEVWDESLIKYGTEIIKAREKYISKINSITRDIHRKLTDEAENLEVGYEKNTSAQTFREDLKNSRRKDLVLNQTTVGPHRDDISFFINGNNVKSYGSQGQQRMAMVSLKLSEISLIREITGDNPVLLLDDVLSELDRQRQELLVKNLGDIQTFITCTGVDDFIEANLSDSIRIFEIEKGNLRRKDEQRY